MSQELSFTEIPDDQKVKLLLESNHALRNKLQAEELENKSLIDEVDMLNKKISTLNSQHVTIQQLKQALGPEESLQSHGSTARLHTGESTSKQAGQLVYEGARKV